MKPEYVNSFMLTPTGIRGDYILTLSFEWLKPKLTEEEIKLEKETGQQTAVEACVASVLMSSTDLQQLALNITEALKFQNEACITPLEAAGRDAFILQITQNLLGVDEDEIRSE